MFFKQIQQHGDNFSYVIANKQTKEAAVIDSSYNAEEITRTIKNGGFVLKYIISTHGHSDHTAGNSELQAVFRSKLVAHIKSLTTSDIKVNDGDILKVGTVQMAIIYTPGHTQDSICLLVDNEKLLTGDTLFVGECGRTDLPGGSAKSMYHSLFDKLLKLADNVEVYPGHNYGVTSSSTIGKERKTNYTLQHRSQEKFIDFMSQP